MKINDISVYICNFNTTDLTNNCIRSIISKLRSVRYEIIIFDNSNRTKFELSSDIKANIKILDNTQGRYINFQKILDVCKHKLMPYNKNNYGSLKHAYTIQYILNIAQHDVLLFDSDTTLLKDIDFLDDTYVTAADLEINGQPDRTGQKRYIAKTRFLPFIQYFNISKIRQFNIPYFRYDMMHGVLGPGNYYDTGACFYKAVTDMNQNFKTINYRDYINHLDHGSWLSMANSTSG